MKGNPIERRVNAINLILLDYEGLTFEKLI